MSATLLVSQSGGKVTLRRACPDGPRPRMLGLFDSVEAALDEAQKIARRPRRNYDGADEVRVLRERKCLCCPTRFQSEGPHHRLCGACRIRVNDCGLY